MPESISALIRNLVCALVCGAATMAHAIELPQQRLAPGGVARIALGASAEAPHASFNGVPVLVLREGAQWVAVVGIALSAKPGAARIEVQRDDGTHANVPFGIEAHRYAEQ